MGVVDGRKLLRAQPINPVDLPHDFPKINLQSAESHSPPTYVNRRIGSDEYFDTKILRNASAFGNLAQYRGNTKTPTALIHHQRFSFALKSGYGISKNAPLACTCNIIRGRHYKINCLALPGLLGR